MKNEIDNLKKYNEIILSEFLRGYYSYLRYKSLYEKKNNYKKEFEQFQDLFTSYSHAYLELSYYALFKILEHSNSKPENRPITLRDLLNKYKQYIENSNIDSKKELLSKINSDKNWISPRNNNLINDLRNLRNNALAHIGNKLISLLSSREDRLKYVEYIFDINTRDPEFLYKLYKKIGDMLIYYNDKIFSSNPDIFCEHIPILDEKKLFLTIRNGLK